MGAKKVNSYTADDITKLEFPHAIWKRNSMYLGARGTQKTIAVREIQDNAVHEAVRGYADRVRIVFGADKSITVQDNGRGLPTEINKKTGINGIVLTMATLHAGANFSSNVSAGKAGAGVNGVGAAACNAMSKRFDVTVYKNKKQFSLSFHDGFSGHFSGDTPDSNFTPGDKIVSRKDSRSAEEKKLFPTGTCIRMWFNPDRFPADEEVDVDDLVDRLRYTAYIVPGLTIDVIDETKTHEDGSFYEWSFYSDAGLREMVEAIAPATPLPESDTPGDNYTSKGIYDLRTEGHYSEITSDDKGKAVELKRTVTTELAFAYNTGYERNVTSFVNTIHTHLGGVHEQALEKAFVDAFGERMSSMRGILTAKDEQPIAEDFFEGITLALSVNVPEPQFVGQQKDKLSGPEVKKVLTKALTKELTKFAQAPKNQKILKPMFEKIAKAAKNRRAAADAKAAKRKSNQVSSSAMPTKLADCEITGEEESELLICLSGDTEILLPDGETPTIESLVGKSGFSVCSFNGKENIVAPVTKVFKTRDVTETLILETENGSNVECTPEHKFLVKNTWVEARDMRVGDVVCSFKNQGVKITGIRAKTYSSPKPVYCLEVDHEFHAFVLANGMITHNCEGDSAAGTVRKARNSMFQSVLPIRGKILNGYTSTNNEILKNKEIMDIAKAIGAGFGKNFDIEKIRYGKVLICADSDVDGLHINNLLYSVFNRCFRPLIEEGRLYQTVPPLYEITPKEKNSKTLYASDNAELQEITSKLKQRGVEYKIEYNKGLGEMSPEAFYETVLDPENRILRRITIHDVEKAEEFLEIIMGKDTSVRKELMTDTFQDTIDSGMVMGFEHGVSALEE